MKAFYGWDGDVSSFWLDYNAVLHYARVYGFKTPPHVYRGPFDFKVLEELAEGSSLVEGAAHIREGIVVKTIPERCTNRGDRAQAKLVSSEYLSHKKGN